MIPLHDDNPIRIRPVVTVALIAACTLAFFFQSSMDPRSGQLFVYQFGAIPALLFHSEGLIPQIREIQVIPAYLSLFTSMFLHGGFMHLAGNMLYLWIFGNNIEDVMGHGRFIGFYLVCGVIAALSHALTDAGSNVPMIGASGAISGVLGAYLLLFPRAQVLVLIPLGFFIRMMYVPAWLVLGLWFLLQLVSGSASIGRGGGGVAWFAHVGGFVAGMVLIGFFKDRSVHLFNPAHRHPKRMEPWRW